MEKSVLEKKWKAVFPEGSNGYWYVKCGEFEICSTYGGDDQGERAKQIAKDHNKQLKVKKDLAKTPFAT